MNIVDVAEIKKAVNDGCCLVSDGNDIPHNWKIKDKLRELL